MSNQKNSDSHEGRERGVGGEDEKDEGRSTTRRRGGGGGGGRG